MALIRRQIVLLHFLLNQVDEVNTTALMKWLFLYKQGEVSQVSKYGFVPYMYGPHSFEAYRDIKHSLARLVETTQNGVRLRDEQVRDEVTFVIKKLSKKETSLVEQVWDDHRNLELPQLIEEVYREHPWYTLNSTIAGSHPERPVNEEAVHTIGYEGRSIDTFLNDLLCAGIQRVIDVRRNAFSHKYGFTLPQIERMCNNVNIDYVHMPDLGIESAERKSISSTGAFKLLFDKYEASLVDKDSQVEAVSEALIEKPSVMLCFEARACDCHRGRLANVVSGKTGLRINNI